jgi:hypothetical protein
MDDFETVVNDVKHLCKSNESALVSGLAGHVNGCAILPEFLAVKGTKYILKEVRYS